MKTIVFIINYIENGGPSKILMNLLRNFDKKKFSVVLITLKNKNNRILIEELKKYGVNVEEMEFNTNFEILKNKSRIIRLIESFSPNIVHSHGFIPDVINASVKSNVKKITTIHNNMYEDYINSFGLYRGRLYIFLHTAYLRRIEKIICCSESSYNILKNKCPYLNSTYIRNGVDIKASDIDKSIRKELGIPQDALVFIYCGNLSKGKRIIELTEQMKNNLKDNEYFLILGKGPLYKELLSYSSNNIRVLGFKNNISDYYAIANVYVSNSSSEGFSTSVIEALGNNLYLLLSDIPSHKECFNIDNNYYIGEYFNSNNFKIKKEVLTSNLTTNKNRNNQFQCKYLSGVSMYKQYEKEYTK